MMVGGLEPARWGSACDVGSCASRLTGNGYSLLSYQHAIFTAEDMPELETVMGRIGIPDLVMFSCLFLMIGFVLGLASASYIL